MVLTVKGFATVHSATLVHPSMDYVAVVNVWMAIMDPAVAYVSIHCSRSFTLIN